MIGKRGLGAVAALIIGASSSGCAGNTRSAESAALHTADGHAATAGTVMTRNPPETSANDAAWGVVGTRNDTTIEAMVATGTTYDGRVVLRIAVDPRPGQVGDAPATRCYSYRFRHLTTDDRPVVTPCPHAAAITLTRPTPEPVLDTPAAVARLRRLLGRLGPAQRHDAAAVQRILAVSYPPPVHVDATLRPNGTLGVGVRTYDTCLTATVSRSRSVRVVPAHGTDCRGG